MPLWICQLPVVCLWTQEPVQAQAVLFLPWEPKPSTPSWATSLQKQATVYPEGRALSKAVYPIVRLQSLPLSRFPCCLRALAQSFTGISALPSVPVGSDTNLRQLICQQPALYFELFFQCGYELIPPHPCSHIRTPLWPRGIIASLWSEPCLPVLLYLPWALVKTSYRYYGHYTHHIYKPLQILPILLLGTTFPVITSIADKCIVILQNSVKYHPP